MYQGIFDTDFDKYTEDGHPRCSLQRGLNTVFEKPRGISRRLEDKIRRRSSNLFREHQCPSFLEYGEYPFVSAGENQEGFKAEGRPSSKMLDQMQ